MLELTADAIDHVTLPGPGGRLYLRRPESLAWSAFQSRARRLAERCDGAGARWSVVVLRDPVVDELRLPAGDYVCVLADSLPFAEFDRADQAATRLLALERRRGWR